MQKEFVTYKIALKLKELGFDEECFAIYFKGILNNGYSVNYISTDWKSLFYKNKINSESNSIDIVSAPLWQQVIDFFREKHNIQIEILWRGDMDTFNYKIGTFQYGTYIFSDKDWKFEEYYEAREQAILKVIEIINQNNNGTN